MELIYLLSIHSGGDVQLVTEQVGGCSWSWEKFGSISIEAVVVVLVVCV